ncbi:MAG: hypothetical protein GC208_09490 [Alphaproteobacteria bacterium]|nr:hypothetical protein [Alphaproteobacteria bacterium]
MSREIEFAHRLEVGIDPNTDEVMLLLMDQKRRAYAAVAFDPITAAPLTANILETATEAQTRRNQRTKQ